MIRTSGYINNPEHYAEFLEMYAMIVKEFGDCLIVVGSKEYRDVILFKDKIETCLNNRQFNWCCIQSME